MKGFMPSFSLDLKEGASAMCNNTNSKFTEREKLQSLLSHDLTHMAAIIFFTQKDTSWAVEECMKRLQLEIKRLNRDGKYGLTSDVWKR